MRSRANHGVYLKAGPVRISTPKSEPAAKPTKEAVLELDAVFLDARRRVAMVFRANMVLSLTAAATLIGTTAATVVFSLLGRTTWAAALGGVALLDLIGAAVYKPLEQMSRALDKAQKIDMLMAYSRDRLKAIDHSAGNENQAVATEQAWADVMAALRELR